MREDGGPLHTNGAVFDIPTRSIHSAMFSIDLVEFPTFKSQKQCVARRYFNKFCPHLHSLLMESPRHEASAKVGSFFEMEK